MECACGFSGGVDDYATVLSDKVQKARKPHQCGECLRTIEPGEDYRVEKTLYEGRVDTIKTCLDCISLRKHLCEDYYYGGVRELVREGIGEQEGEVSEKCLAPLTPKAREWVCEIIEDIWRDKEEEGAQDD